MGERFAESWSAPRQSRTGLNSLTTGHPTGADRICAPRCDCCSQRQKVLRSFVVVQIFSQKCTKSACEGADGRSDWTLPEAECHAVPAGQLRVACHSKRT